MAFCPACGSQIPDGSASCPNCGNTATRAAAPPPPPPGQNPTGNPQQNNRGSQAPYPGTPNYGGQSPYSGTPNYNGQPPYGQQSPYGQPPEKSGCGKAALIGCGVLAVIFVIGVLAAILVPAFIGYNKKAQEARERNGFAACCIAEEADTALLSDYLFR